MRFKSLLSTALIFAGLPCIFAADASFTPPVSPRATYSFNPGWKFIREDVATAEQVAFDDSKWVTVSAPHTYNETDSYTQIISHSGGDRPAYAGIAWYRKHFKLPASAKGGKVFLEFEGLKQAGRFWINGKLVGRFENGITACGLDFTESVNFGDAENVIAVKVDNSNDYKEEATGTEFEWMGRAFNPNYGGLNHDIWLHLTGKVYQTLPLYENLKTTGTYIYPSNFSIKDKTCDVNIEAQVRNESGDQQSITLSAVVVDADGKVCAEFQSDALDLVSGQTETFTANGKLADAKFWSDENPNLYNVYSILTVNDKVVDVQKIKTGFRKTEFKGGVGTGGVWLNDKFVWLTGYAQRSSDDWAGLGEAYPDWMHDYNANLVRSTHANYIRWMHISPQAVDVRACDKAGIIEVCPAGDKEKDAVGRQWEQRVEVMRVSMIYFRNSPSILFWEAGNTVVTADHMRQMVALRKELDPNGGRVMGTRGDSNDAANTALTPIAEYYGVMLGQDRRTDELTNRPPVANPDNYSVSENSVTNVLTPLGNDVVVTPGGSLTVISVIPTNGTTVIAGGTNVLFTPATNFVGVATIGYTITDEVGGTNSSLITVTVMNRTDMFRAYSAERRDRAPFIETEDFRDEAARRFWDDYSPPHFGFKPGPNDVYHWNSETFCLAAAQRYHEYYLNRISNPDQAHSKWAGYASIYWSDSNADGRQDSSEVCRVSGKVDSVRLPKQAYYVYRVMQNGQPDIHIIGHWNYPANTVKTVYVAANHCDTAELFVNGKSQGTVSTPMNGYIFVFPEIKFEPGKISAVAKVGGKIVAQDEIETPGEAKALKLTPHIGPNGLQADGSDVAFFDVEVVDVRGRRCPTDEARVDFKLDGPALWRGGYNSGITNSINNLWLKTECGVNRVAIRSTLQPGTITLTATRAGLEPDMVKIESRPVAIKAGLMP